MIRNVSFYLIFSLINKGMTFFLVPVFTHLLAPGELGTVRHSIAIGAVIVLLFTLGLDESAARFHFASRQAGETRNPVLGRILLIALIASLTAVIVMWPFADVLLLDSADDQALLKAGLLIFIGCSPLWAIFRKVLRLEESVVAYGLATLGHTVVFVSISTYMIVAMGFGAAGYMTGFAAATALFACVSVLGVYRRSSFDGQKSQTRAVVRYGIGVLPHVLLSWGLGGITLVLVGYFLDSGSVGIFVAMGFLGALISILAQAVFDAFQPWSYRKLSTGKSGVADFAVASKGLGVAFVMLGMTLALFAEELLTVLIDAAYLGWIEIAPILILASVILAIGSVSMFVLYFEKQAGGRVSLPSFGGAICNVVLLFALVPLFGLIAAAVSLTVANLVTAVGKQYMASNMVATKLLTPDLFLLAVTSHAGAYVAVRSDIFLFGRMVIWLVFACAMSVLYWRVFSTTIRKMRWNY